MSNGKGDKPRPVSNRSQYYSNWEGINWGRESPSKESRDSKSPFTLGDGDGDYFIVPEASPFPEPPE